MKSRMSYECVVVLIELNDEVLDTLNIVERFVVFKYVGYFRRSFPSLLP
ncbi:MAG: hypothetical protein RIR26_2031 [Pseudomonadota bacterium]|jgi:hypothetical protein